MLMDSELKKILRLLNSEYGEVIRYLIGGTEYYILRGIMHSLANEEVMEKIKEYCKYYEASKGDE